MDKQIRILFVFTANQYNVLNEMLWKVADCLENQYGYFVGRYRLDDYEKVAALEWDVIFSGQAIEFSECKKEDDRIHITWFVDHPRYLLPRMLDYPQMDKVYIGCVDRRHVNFVRKYYGINNAFFAPHFGWKASNEIPYTDRTYEVFFPASNVRWEEDVRNRYLGLEGPLKVITEKTIEFLLHNTEYSLEEAMEYVLRSYGETEVLELSRECIEAAGEYIDFYVRIYVRNKVIRALLNAGITVTVCGRNWKEFPENEQEKKYLQILSEEMPYGEVVETMANSKMVLNVMPWFKDGCHERIAMACLNGAVCVTDKSQYIQENWSKDEMLLYDWRNTDALVEEIQALLDNPKEAVRIAKKGRHVAETIAMVEKYCEYIKLVIEKEMGIV